MIVAYSPLGRGLASIGGGGGGAAGAAALATALGVRGLLALLARFLADDARTVVAFLGRDGLARPERPRR